VEITPMEITPVEIAFLDGAARDRGAVATRRLRRVGHFCARSITPTRTHLSVRCGVRAIG
jgi:hypothetical protein